MEEALGLDGDRTGRLRLRLESLYQQYNRLELAQNDPIRFVYDYADPRDREIVGLVASSLALGNVTQILRSVEWVVGRMGLSPRRFVGKTSESKLRSIFATFRHRFVSGDEVASLLFGVKRALKRFGSIEACFVAGLDERNETILPALAAFTKQLTADADGKVGHLIPSPEKGSACKRLNLYLRWMVRRDRVDPGVWNGIAASRLIVPLDTHMFRIGRAMGLTQRKQANMSAALEITDGFRRIVPDDPTRYDFALTHFSMEKRQDLSRLVLLSTTQHNKGGKSDTLTTKTPRHQDLLVSL